MKSVTDIKKEITWYTDELRANERDLETAKRRVLDLEEKVRLNRKELELYKLDLPRAEEEEKHKKAP